MSMEVDTPQARPRVESIGRVHFVDTQVTPDHQGQIMVSFSPDQSHADAHLGFLQRNRRYGVVLTIPKYLGDSLSIIKKNPHVKLLANKSDPEKTKQILELQLDGHHDGLQNEEIILRLPETRQPFILTLSARVLGVGKGTPMLKSGIHLLETLQPDTSETSESEDTKRNGDGDGNKIMM